jgi:hypothetical protein
MELPALIERLKGLKALRLPGKKVLVVLQMSQGLFKALFEQDRLQSLASKIAYSFLKSTH